MTKRIIITTFGSLGDLHPYIALGSGLKARGHQITLAASVHYKQRIIDQGLNFNPLSPDLSADVGDKEVFISKALDSRRGVNFLLCQVILPALRNAYKDLLPIIPTADLLISHPLTFITPIIAEQYQKIWVGTALQPLAFKSAYDPYIMPGVPLLNRLRSLAPKFYRYLFGFFKWLAKSKLSAIQPLCQEIDRLRQDVGLPLRKGHPFFEGIFSPYLNLALFSQLLAQAQPDWPVNVQITGFPLFDKDEGQHPLDPQVGQFLRDGSPPLVFTLGSLAVKNAGDFYKESMLAVQKLGQRAVLIIGRDPRNRFTQPLPKEILAVEYIPYSEIFAHAAAIVHSGGIGTTAQALYSGRPMLVVPYGFDQPSNAARIVNLGVGRTITPNIYNAQTAAQELANLLDNKQYAEKAQQISQQLHQEDGVGQACNAIEQLLYKQNHQ